MMSLFRPRKPLVQTKWILVWGVLLLVGIALFVWTLKDVPFTDIGAVLGKLQWWQLLVLFLVNIGILLLFPLRWWLTLRAQGREVPYLLLVRYRQIAFAISYFTPGQHFGGEPVQVLMLHSRHKIPSSTALASVSMDRIVELLANFTVLILAIAVVLTGGVVSNLPINQALPISLLLLLIPAGYLAALWAGRRPLATITRRFKGKTAKGLRSAEDQLGDLAAKKPKLFFSGLAAGGLVWIALIFEIWLCVYFLGFPLSSLELALVVVASRIALFAPTPGALGALEASQVLAMQALGYEPALGLSLALLIRARDVFFGLGGLGLGALTRR